MSKDAIYREDAIKAIKSHSYALGDDYMEINGYSAIDDIRALPSADRPQKAIAQITFDEEKLREIVKEAVERFKEEYEITDRPQGEWIRTFDGNEWYWYCSNCKEEWYEEDLWMGGNEFPHFCPNCGCRMKGADDE